MHDLIKKILNQEISKDEIIEIINSNHKLFVEAIEIAISAKQPYAWRVSWILNHCMVKNDQRFEKYIDKIIKSIDGKNDGHQRELLKILQNLELNDEQEGLIFDICMNIWESLGKSSSVRIVAFKILANIVKKYPELINEVEFLTQEQYLETLSPGIKKSFKKLRW